VTDTLLEELKASQQLMVAMTQLVADDHPGRVGAWTLRDIAAHLATTEKECFEPRIRAMAAGERPKFEFYSNDDRDFEGISLESALTEWAGTLDHDRDHLRSLERLAAEASR
jgi:hypothetical protein